MGTSTCNRNVTFSAAAPFISSLDCQNAHLGGAQNIIAGNYTGNSYFSVPYQGGNGGNYAGGTFFSTGVTGLTATIPPTTLGSLGNLSFTIKGTPSAAGTATFEISLGDKNCIVNVTVKPPSSATTGTATLNCSKITDNGIGIIQGTQASGVSIYIPYTGGNNLTYASQSIPIENTGLMAVLNSGIASNNGTLIYNITGVAASNATQGTFQASLGGNSCNVTVYIKPSIQPTAYLSMNCSPGAVTTDNVFWYSGQYNSGRIFIPYSQGNGLNYPTQSLISTGVSGLSAVLNSGVTYPSGTLVYKVLGTPSASGIATFYPPSIGGGAVCPFQLRIN